MIIVIVIICLPNDCVLSLEEHLTRTYHTIIPSRRPKENRE